MSKRNIILVLFLVFALLLCEINLTVTDASSRFISNVSTDGGTVQDESLSPVLENPNNGIYSRESLTRNLCGSLFNLRSQTKGKGFQRLGLRILLLLISVLCLFRIAFRYLRCGPFLPADAIASSLILFFIHDKDGKK